MMLHVLLIRSVGLGNFIKCVCVCVRVLMFDTRY